MITFEVSGLSDETGNALTKFEIEFSEPVNADWLISVIKKAIDEFIICPDCKKYFNKNGHHWCINK